MQSKGLSRVFSNTTVQKHQFFGTQPYFIVQLSHPYMTTGKTIALTRWTFVGKVMSLFFNMLSRLVITFLPRSKCLLISWLQSPSAVILEPQKIRSLTVSIVFPFICHEVMGLSHPYMATGKTIALTLWTSVGKMMSLFFNMLSRLVIAFLPRSKRLNFVAAVTVRSDFGAQESSFSLNVS